MPLEVSQSPFFSASHFECTYLCECGYNLEGMTWQQLGSDLDGDKGIFLDFVNKNIRTGDTLGMALQLRDDGERITIGAPYYFWRGGRRDSEHYYGKVKLFEFEPADE